MKKRPHKVACEAAYKIGVIARKQNKHKDDCRYATHSQLWSWWMAGWNDEDLSRASNRKSA